VSESNLGSGPISFFYDCMQDDRVIPASEVVANVTVGEPAEFDNFVVIYTKTFSTMKIDSPVHSNHKLFRNSVSCKSTTFNNTTYFRFYNFSRTATFRDSKFNGYSYFGNRSAYFRSSDFIQRFQLRKL
jgi:hypothetical protein